jgi:beta-galactosidase GanA
MKTTTLNSLRCFSLASALAVTLGFLRIDIAMARPGTNGQPDMPKVRVAEDNRTFTGGNQKAFVPMGVTYYRPGTGWAPQVWKQFDGEATRKDFVQMRERGINCVRVFLTFGSFYRKTGELDASGLAKFDEFLAIAEQTGIYVHPAGPDHWEGMPSWNPAGIEDERTLAALEEFWKLFAARYRGRTSIFAYDLRNEPEVGWNDRMTPAWNAWLTRHYGGAEAIAKAWGRTNAVEIDKVPVPTPTEALNNRELLDFQRFREDLADEWTRRQVAAIKSSDPQALVTVGMIQWSVPALLPPGVRHYAAFRPSRQAKLLDFLEVHFYPLT